ncbi:hypothetical protein SEA_SHAGRAT_1 [Rhodococcus phage Shagrat]|nr:hypothetical protein SEA_SHAGRAT_1 [Rhodococcus phage Shagrat]
MPKNEGGYPNRKELADRYMKSKDPAERRRLAAQLRAIKAARAKPSAVKIIECRWDLTRRYVKERLRAGWTPRECDWCGGLYPARNAEHIYCSRICFQSAEPRGRPERIRRAVTHGHD